MAELSTKALSYLGDAVYELCVRNYLVTELGISDAAELNERAKGFVSAAAQAELMPLISDMLTEEESAVFRRARNKGHSRVAHNVDPAQYRVATGLEALFGFLYAEERFDRIRELFYTIKRSRSFERIDDDMM